MPDTAVKTASSWLPLIVTCVAAIGAWFTLKAEADGLKDDVLRLERQVVELQSTKEDLAVIGSKISMLENTLYRIEDKLDDKQDKK